MPDQESLHDRCIRLGVKPEQLDDAIAYLGQNAVSIHFHKFADDAEVSTKLSKFTRPEQSEAPSGDPFKLWLGKLADGFERMPPVRRMMLHREYKESLLAKPDAAQALNQELQQRYGATADPNMMTPTDKLRAAHVFDLTNKVTKPAPIQLTAALAALPSGKRLMAARAVQEAATLRGSNREFDQRRLTALRAEWPGIIPD